MSLTTIPGCALAAGRKSASTPQWILTAPACGTTRRPRPARDCRLGHLAHPQHADVERAQPVLGSGWAGDLHVVQAG